MAEWLVKTEPSEYSFDHLERAGKAVWDGVRNPAALKNLARHEGGRSRGRLSHRRREGGGGPGRGRAGGLSRPQEQEPALGWWSGSRPASGLPRPVTLAEIKALPVFAESPLVRQGRLSVVPLTAAQWKALEAKSRR